MLVGLEVGEPEAVSLNRIAYGYWDVAAELWAPVTKRVKLAPFAAGIDASRQISQEISSYCRPTNLLSNCLGSTQVSTAPRPAASILRARAGVSSEVVQIGKSGSTPVPLKRLIRYSRMSCKEQVAEGNVADSRCPRLSNRRPHPLLIDLVGAGIGQHDRDQG